MERSSIESKSYGSGQLTVLVVLRMLIGWHFLYEGTVKVFNPGWSSAGYLMDSGGIFAGLYKAMAENAALLPIVDFLNVWGLVFIGLGLLLGLFTRVATIGGIVLLLMYYFSHPPIIGLNYALPNEGSYLIVNKTLIEAFALAVLAYFPTGKEVGLDRLLFSVNKNKGMEDKHRGEKFEAA